MAETEGEGQDGRDASNGGDGDALRPNGGHVNGAVDERHVGRPGPDGERGAPVLKIPAAMPTSSLSRPSVLDPDEDENADDGDDEGAAAGTTGRTNGAVATTTASTSAGLEPSTTAPSSAMGGARPKVRSGRHHRARRTNADNGADSSDSDQPVVATTNGHDAAADSDGDASDDLYVYTYRGGAPAASHGADNGDVGGISGNGGVDYLSADLPKSFFHDTGSESEGPVAAQGVSGAGQSNLSTEVAALLQSELASLHVSSREAAAGGANARGGRRRVVAANGRRSRSGRGGGHNNGASAAGDAPAPLQNGGGDSPEMDYLEMDFVDSGNDGDSDNDSGQGGDENVTETNEEDSEADGAVADLPNHGEQGEPGDSEAASAANGGAGGGGFHPWNPDDGNPPWGPSTTPPPGVAPRETSRVPDSLPNLSERGEKSKNPNSSLSSQPRRHVGPSASSGVTSAPAVTPVREDLSLMVRSRSLNSPLSKEAGGAHGGGPRLGLDADLSCMSRMSRGESDPLVGGPGAAAPSSSAQPSSLRRPGFDPLVNMEVCGSRLSQREAMLFQVPEADSLVRQGRAAENLTAGARSIISEKTMIWSELEACKRQVTQVGRSACGATALVNALSALNGTFSSATASSFSAAANDPQINFTVESVESAVRTRLRAERAPVPEYLFSRSRAGATAADLVRAVNDFFGDSAFARFFPLHPRRRVHLSSWLQHWIRRGAVPVVTGNPQRGPLRPGQALPDAWHHQMAFGVGPSGVYLTNPLEIVPERVLHQQLCSPSVLLVRRGDVVFRHQQHDVHGGGGELHQLALHDDQRWDHLNVLGQVVNVLREESAAAPSSSSSGRGAAASGGGMTQHVVIPADYRSGVTLVLPRSSPHLGELQGCPDLPMAEEEEGDTDHQQSS